MNFREYNCFEYGLEIFFNNQIAVEIAERDKLDAVDMSLIDKEMETLEISIELDGNIREKNRESDGRIESDKGRYKMIEIDVITVTICY